MDIDLVCEEASLREECGVVGVLGDIESSRLVYLGLYALQHRGQEACGIVTMDSEDTIEHKSLGLVSDGFHESTLKRLKGHQGIGHVRYSTHGGRTTQNIQPFTFHVPRYGKVSLAHNGNLTNGDQLRNELEESGSVFTSTTETEVFIHLVARSRAANLADRIIEAVQQVKGAFSLIVMSKGKLFAIRDPFGFRPLVIGRRGNTWVVASETCALDLLDAKYQRDVEVGEMVELCESGDLVSYFPFEKTASSFCSFEPIYFSRPDSIQNGDSVYVARKKMGEQLAKEIPTEADVVVAIPDSGVPMAMGYSECSGLPLDLGLIRNHYVGRTFIEPTQASRDFGVKLKLNAVERVLKDKRVVVIDDSIVRGTTCAKIVRLLRQAGAKEIHFRSGCPPITHSCYYGVNTPERGQLLAAQKSVEEIRTFIGADTLGFLSIDGLRKALGTYGEKDRHCFACFTGNYPETIYSEISREPTDVGGPGLYSGANDRTEGGET